MAEFVQFLEENQKILKFSQNLEEFTDEFMKPFIEAMTLEGSYNMKEPCYNKSLVNKKSPKCL